MTDKLQSKTKVEVLLRHIRLVQDACLRMGLKLIEDGEVDFGKSLIANSMEHDLTKFFGLEWDTIASNDDDFDAAHRKLAIYQHQRTNKHHPEFWSGIENMPRIYIYEMIADWKARSDEFGTDLRKWVKETAIKRYNISPQGKVWKEIKKALDLLLEKPFS